MRREGEKEGAKGFLREVGERWHHAHASPAVLEGEGQQPVGD